MGILPRRVPFPPGSGCVPGTRPCAPLRPRTPPPGSGGVRGVRGSGSGDWTHPVVRTHPGVQGPLRPRVREGVPRNRPPRARGLSVYLPTKNLTVGSRICVCSRLSRLLCAFFCPSRARTRVLRRFWHECPFRQFPAVYGHPGAIQAVWAFPACLSCLFCRVFVLFGRLFRVAGLRCRPLPQCCCSESR